MTAAGANISAGEDGVETVGDITYLQETPPTR